MEKCTVEDWTLKELAEALAEAEAFVANKACYDGQQKEVEDRIKHIEKF